jgi:hypothetical protein
MDEVGSALGVLALIVLVMLAPVHAAAQFRVLAGDAGFASVLCATGHGPSAPATGGATPICDLCVPVSFGHACCPPMAALLVPLRLAPASAAWLPAETVASAQPAVGLAEARAPPAV